MHTRRYFTLVELLVVIAIIITSIIIVIGITSTSYIRNCTKKCKTHATLPVMVLIL